MREIVSVALPQAPCGRDTADRTTHTSLRDGPVDGVKRLGEQKLVQRDRIARAFQLAKKTISKW